jgi:hypothetical protein
MFEMWTPTNETNFDLLSEAVFYIITQNRHTGYRNVYITVPLLMTERGPDWTDISDAFCSSNSSSNTLEQKGGYGIQFLLINVPSFISFPKNRAANIRWVFVIPHIRK